MDLNIIPLVSQRFFKMRRMLQFIVDWPFHKHGCRLTLVDGFGCDKWTYEILGCWLMGVLPDLLVFIPNSFFLDDDLRLMRIRSLLILDGTHGKHTKSRIVSSGRRLGSCSRGFSSKSEALRKVVYGSFAFGTKRCNLAVASLVHPHLQRHTDAYCEILPTPFLAPFSDIQVDGYRWSTPWVWFTNLAIILAIWSYVFYKKRNQSLIEERA